MFDVDEAAPIAEHDLRARPLDHATDAFDSHAAEEELATLSAHLDAATYRQLVLIRQLDDCGHWATAGSATCAAWLSYRIGMDVGAARERLRVAHALRDLPKISEAMRRGTISYSKVRAITRAATPALEERLLEYARYTTASQLERICRGIKQAQLLATEDGERLDDAELLRRAFESRDVVLRSRGDGTVQVVVTLLPDEAQRVFTAVEAMRDAMREECPSFLPSYADAFVRLIDVGYEEATVVVPEDSDAAEGGADVSAEVGGPAEASVSADGRADVSAEMAAAGSPPSLKAASRKKVCGGDTQRVVIHLAPHLLSDGLVANLDDGTWISPETWRRVACDCALELVKLDEAGAVLDVGRKTRTIPPALTRALDVRDAGRCRFPGCTHRRFLHRHHIEHWSQGGETKLDNLITLCTVHHHLVHEGGWTVALDGDEALFHRPDGTLLVWPKPVWVDDAVAKLEEAHAELELGPATGLTLWNGRTPDYHACVSAVACDTSPMHATS